MPTRSRREYYVVSAWRRTLRTYATLEIDLHADLEEPWRQHRRGRQPRLRSGRCRRIERLVIGQDRRGVREIVDVEPDRVSRPANPDDLGKAHVERVDTIAPDLTGRDQIYRDRRSDDRRGPTERC